jgi:predicted DNA-binding ArsR family transcriptional regulator
VWYLGYSKVQQVDLSDDIVVSFIADDAWEEALQKVSQDDENGKEQVLELSREAFYSLPSLFMDPDEMEGEGESQ